MQAWSKYKYFGKAKEDISLRWKGKLKQLDVHINIEGKSQFHFQGPYNARTWAQRKAAVCPENINFKKCADLLTKLELRRKDSEEYKKTTEDTTSDNFMSKQPKL